MNVKWSLSVTSRRVVSIYGVFCAVLVLVKLTYAGHHDKPVTYTGHKVIRVYPTTRQQMDIVRQVHNDLHHGIDVWGETKQKRCNASAIDLQLSPEVYDIVTSRLTRSGVRYDVTVDDLQSAIENQRADIQRHRAAVRRRRSTAVTSSELDDIVGTYSSHSEINEWLTSLEERFADIVKLHEIGRSYEGRRLLVIQIGAKTVGDTSKPKPSIWIDAGIHAREWIAPATSVYIIRQLVSGYKDDVSTRRLLETYDWYILPVVNPDGYEYSNTTDRMWRKTRSRVASSGLRGCVGVDGNRNFDFQWMSECRGSRVHCRGARPCENVYAGQKPLSEPETMSMANFIMDRRQTIRMYISLHSYSQLWLTPWGYTTTPPPDQDELMSVASRAVDTLESVYNTEFDYGSPAVILYEATGGSFDWAKGVAGIKYSFTLELRDKGEFGFLLPSNQIIPTGRETFAAIQTAAEQVALDECWVYGRNCPGNE